MQQPTTCTITNLLNLYTELSQLSTVTLSDNVNQLFNRLVALTAMLDNELTQPRS